MKILLSTFILITSLFIYHQISEHKLCSGFFPENDLYFPVDAINSSSISNEDFNNIMKEVSSIYTPIAEKEGGKLHISGNWNDGTVNAYANRAGKHWYVNMFGGLARHTLMTNDGFAAVICHELGHHLGQQPKTKFFFMSLWASNEGQSDYFATLKCLRKYFESKDNNDWLSRNEPHSIALEKCTNIFDSEKEQAVCIRSTHAGINLANILNSLRDGSNEIELSTPDTKVVRRTYNKHPKAQCRLDTYAAGAFCDKHHEEEIGKRRTTTEGLCTRKQKYEIGIRPRCWYKPVRSIF